LNPPVIGLDLEYCTDGVFVASALMQLSYINIDLVIDVYILRESISTILTPLFSNPNVVKLVHGGDTDISLIISDLNIQIVNVFDTSLAFREIIRASETC